MPWIQTGECILQKNCLKIRSACFHTCTIRKTCPCNVYPLEPQFYIAKLGYAAVYLFFLFLLQNIGCGYSLEPPRRVYYYLEINFACMSLQTSPRNMWFCSKIHALIKTFHEILNLLQQIYLSYNAFPNFTICLMFYV